MHPTSIIQLNMFGEYTKNFAALVEARLAIKNGDYESARGMLGGKLAPYLKDAKNAKDLSWALKIIINIVYGLTSATFDSPFRDKRNKDNIAAKRGALFMIELKNHLQELGYKVLHIKTDSIKIANCDDETVDLIYNFGQKYGYTFEHEATYSKFCLVNDAVYVAKTEGNDGGWSATGAQFKVPFVFKTLFSGEAILPQDLAETKQVAKGYMYLKFEKDQLFVGKTGRFIPVVSGGGELIRKDATGKEFAVTGTKGYRWLESDAVKAAKLDPEVDVTYFEKLVDKAKETIEQFGSFEEFVA
jgi:hypothetical protein